MWVSKSICCEAEGVLSLTEMAPIVGNLIGFVKYPRARNDGHMHFKNEKVFKWIII